MKGYVIAQSIAKQTQFTKGQIHQIILTISQGKEPSKQTPTTRNSSTKRPAATTKAPQSNTTDQGYKVNGTSKDNDKKDYTTIHLD